MPNVTKVTIYGTQEERIFVDFDHVKLANLGIGPQAILDSLAKQNAVVPAGIVQTDGPRIPLRVTGAFDGVETVKNTPVASANGTIFRLGDIATVTRGFVDPPDFLIRQRGAPALALGVVMQKGANILTLGEDIDAAMAEIMRATPVGFTYERIANQPKIVEEAVGDFMRSFVEALVIVLAVSFLSLGWRTGHRRRAVGAAGARHRVHHHADDRPRSAPHHARRADHRARPDGRRRHHRGRDDAGEDGAGRCRAPRRPVGPGPRPPFRG